MKKIPFADLKRQYAIIKDDIDAAIKQLFTDFAFIGSINNPHVSRFERHFSEYLGVGHVVGCANGTDAIEIALKVLGIGPGDEVIVPAISWFSTSEAVSQVGAKPIFVDVNESDLTLNCDLVVDAITSKTKAIIPVHLYGNVADMGCLKQIAKEHNLFIIEDCAQAHGAKFREQVVGTIGDISTFSFYPGKNLGAYGDAGAIVTNNKDYAEIARMICQHGQVSKHNHKLEGRNSRLDGIHAAVLDVKINHLPDWTSKRRKIADRYLNGINTPLVEPLITSPNSHGVYHLFVVKTEVREELVGFLKTKGIGTAIHYPTPLPFLPPYQDRNYSPSDFPVAFNAKDQILSIPMYPEMSIEEVDYVIECLNEFN